MIGIVRVTEYECAWTLTIRLSFQTILFSTPVQAVLGPTLPTIKWVSVLSQG